MRIFARPQCFRAIETELLRRRNSADRALPTPQTRSGLILGDFYDAKAPRNSFVSHGKSVKIRREIFRGSIFCLNLFFGEKSKSEA